MKIFSSIWIIDDDPITVFGMRKILQSVVICDDLNTFNNGKVAIDEIKSNPNFNKNIPELIFLDINMPIMDGWQFLEEFIQLPIEKSVRVNIITSSIDTTDLEKWRSYLHKTHHIITYNNKPMHRDCMAKITNAA